MCTHHYSSVQTDSDWLQRVGNLSAFLNDINRQQVFPKFCRSVIAVTVKRGSNTGQQFSCCQMRKNFNAITSQLPFCFSFCFLFSSCEEVAFLFFLKCNQIIIFWLASLVCFVNISKLQSLTACQTYGCTICCQWHQADPFSSLTRCSVFFYSTTNCV